MSSRQAEFHPKPLTEPYLILSHHTALPDFTASFRITCRIDCRANLYQHNYPMTAACVFFFTQSSRLITIVGLRESLSGWTLRSFRLSPALNTTTIQSAPWTRIGTFSLMVSPFEPFPFSSDTKVLTFHIKACVKLLPSLCRLTCNQYASCSVTVYPISTGSR